MSYDIMLVREGKCESCNREYRSFYYICDPTYNLSSIFDRALTRLEGYDYFLERNLSDTLTWLEKALDHLQNPANEKMFRELEPENKWGTLEWAIEVIIELIRQTKENPDHFWSVQ